MDLPLFSELAIAAQRFLAAHLPIAFSIALINYIINYCNPQRASEFLLPMVVAEYLQKSFSKGSKFNFNFFSLRIDLFGE